MSTLVAGSNPASSFPMLAGINAEGHRRQPLFRGIAVVMLVLILPTLVAYGLDGRTLNGIDVWAKPLKFEASLALYFATLAWFSGYLAEGHRNGRFSRRSD